MELVIRLNGLKKNLLKEAKAQYDNRHLEMAEHTRSEVRGIDKAIDLIKELHNQEVLKVVQM